MSKGPQLRTRMGSQARARCFDCTFTTEWRDSFNRAQNDAQDHARKDDHRALAERETLVAFELAR